MRAKLILLSLMLGTQGLCVAAPALAQQQEAASLTVAVARPVERQWPVTIPASGWLKPWHEALVAAEIDGLRIVEILADIGSVVTRGQPLVRLNDAPVRAELRKAEAALASARADLAKATKNANRARQVGGSGALSDEKVTEYLIAEQTALAGIASAEASLDAQRIRLDQTVIVAPDDGLITARAAQLGAVVTSGTELFRLVRQNRVEWQAEVSGRHLPCIREGLAATISLPDGLKLTGKVRLAGPTVSSDTGRAIAYVSLPPDARPPVGLHVSGQIELEATPALTVPETALVMRDGLAYLFIVGADNRTSRLRVETGRRNGHEVEILSGLDREARVVTAGGAFLSDRTLVRIGGAAR